MHTVCKKTRSRLPLPEYRTLYHRKFYTLNIYPYPLPITYYPYLYLYVPLKGEVLPFVHATCKTLATTNQTQHKKQTRRVHRPSRVAAAADWSVSFAPNISTCFYNRQSHFDRLESGRQISGCLRRH